MFRSMEHDRKTGIFGQPIAEAGEPELIRTLKLGLRIARRRLADHSHLNSPKIYTQPQMFCCLLLRAHLNLTYRKTEELLRLMPAACEAIGLARVPRFTTMQTFANQPGVLEIVDGVLAEIGKTIIEACPQDAAIDGTGCETTSASAHFVSRAGRKRTKYVKLTVAVLCAAAIPAALTVDWGPSHDMRQAWSVRDKLRQAEITPTWLWGDGAYDSEPWHRANWEAGVKSYAPTTIKSKDGRVGGFYRSAFVATPIEYGRRWMCETVNSAAKRISGSTLRSRKENTLFFEAAMKFLAYAVKR